MNYYAQPPRAAAAHAPAPAAPRHTAAAAAVAAAAHFGASRARVVRAPLRQQQAGPPLDASLWFWGRASKSTSFHQAKCSGAREVTAAPQAVETPLDIVIHMAQQLRVYSDISKAAAAVAADTSFWKLCVTNLRRHQLRSCAAESPHAAPVKRKRKASPHDSILIRTEAVMEHRWEEEKQPPPT
ncbi:hypothetical protein Esti_004814 [Eimeria stiedai]